MKKRDNIFFVIQIIVALMAMLLMNLKGNYFLNIPFIFFILFAILSGRFNYSLSMLSNKIYLFFYVRNGYEFEPSDFSLIISKIVSWVFYMFGLSLAFFPENIFG